MITIIFRPWDHLVGMEFAKSASNLDKNIMLRENVLSAIEKKRIKIFSKNFSLLKLLRQLIVLKAQRLLSLKLKKINRFKKSFPKSVIQIPLI